MHGRTDLWIAVFLMVGSGLALSGVAYRVSARARGWRLGAAIGTLALLLLFFGFLLADSVVLARLLPLPCLPVCGNLAFPLSMILAGLLLRSTIPFRRRLLLAALLGILGARALITPLLRGTPDCTDHWHGDVCIQTRPASCSAAAAVTLLRHHGIDATEREMAQLCLTSAKGTTQHGLFRGLLIKTKGTPYRPKVRTLSLADLQPSDELPATISVMLTAEVSEKDPRYEKEWKWQVGVAHTVVILSFFGDDEVLVADPSVGLEEWHVDELGDLMTGTCMFLVAADGTALERKTVQPPRAPLRPVACDHRPPPRESAHGP